MTDKTPYQELAQHLGAGDSNIIPAIFQVLADADPHHMKWIEWGYEAE